MTNQSQAKAESPQPVVALQVALAGGRPQLKFVDHDGFLIGSGDQCDLPLDLPGFPRLHSILHVQGQAVWIEAAGDDAIITVEGEIYRRRALRDGDRLAFGDVSVVVHIGERSVQAAQPVPKPHFQPGKLARMSASDLCDLIEFEEAQIQDFERGRRRGMQALLSAVQEARQVGGHHRESAAQPASIKDDKFDEILTHVRTLSDSLEERTRELATQEAILLESSSQLTEAQRRISRQLEHLLGRLSEDEEPGELRVSA